MGSAEFIQTSPLPPARAGIGPAIRTVETTPQAGLLWRKLRPACSANWQAPGGWPEPQSLSVRGGGLALVTARLNLPGCAGPHQPPMSDSNLEFIRPGRGCSEVVW